MIRVLLADDQELLRAGFRMVLDAQDGIEVVGEAGDGDDAVVLTGRLDPDVVLMDVRMPGVDGIEATRRLVTAGARARVLILTTFDLDEYAFSALRVGASGFLLKDVPPDHLTHAIRAASGVCATSAATRSNSTPSAPGPSQRRPLGAVTRVSDSRSNTDFRR